MPHCVYTFVYCHYDVAVPRLFVVVTFRFVYLQRSLFLVRYTSCRLPHLPPARSYRLRFTLAFVFHRFLPVCLPFTFVAHVYTFRCVRWLLPFTFVHDVYVTQLVTYVCPTLCVLPFAVYCCGYGSYLHPHVVSHRYVLPTIFVVHCVTRLPVRCHVRLLRCFRLLLRFAYVLRCCRARYVRTRLPRCLTLRLVLLPRPLLPTLRYVTTFAVCYRYVTREFVAMPVVAVRVTFTFTCG